MAWMSVDEVNQKIQSVAGIQLSRWPISKIQPELFLLGNSPSNWSGTGAAGAYFKRRSYEINALKIPSRVRTHRYEGSLDHLSVIITGNVLGNELIGPEAVLHFAELFLNAVKGYQQIDSSQQTTTYIPAQSITIDQFTIDHADLEQILERLNIWVVPLVNPGGRDEQLYQQWVARRSGQALGGSPYAGRPNPDGVCLNRNFDIAWQFKKIFKEQPGWRSFLNSMDPYQPDPSDPVANYQGKSPESEPETQALTGLLCKNVQSPGAVGDPSITWLFDIHGQGADYSKVSYPWSWAENQTRDSGMCVANPYYNPPPPPQNVREGYIPYSVNPSAYGEYLPQKTADQLQELAETFTDAAKQGHVASPWETPTQGSAPAHGAAAFPCVGALDDYFLWLDRNHCRAFTIECANLQPPGAIKDHEMDEVAAGLFAAIKQIKDWVVASSNPQQDLSRLSADQLTCP